MLHVYMVICMPCICNNCVYMEICIPVMFNNVTCVFCFVFLVFLTISNVYIAICIPVICIIITCVFGDLYSGIGNNVTCVYAD